MKTADVFNKYTTSHKLSFKSKTMYSYYSRTFQEKFPEDYPTDAFSFNEYAMSLINDKHLAPISVNAHLKYLRAVNHFLYIEFDYPDINKKIRTIKYNKVPRIYYEPDILSRLIIAASDDQEKILVSVLIDSVCRIGELASLQHNDIEDNRFKSSGKTGIQYHRCDPRLCNIMRTISHPGEFVFKVKLHQNSLALPADQILILRADALDKTIRRITKRAGITGKKTGAHTIRHSSASLVARETDSLLMVQHMLGHADSKMSQTYIHDIQAKLIQKVSPLQLVKDAISDPNQFTQSNLLTTGEQTTTEIIATTTNTVDEIIASSFKEVPDTRKAHVQLSPDDLRLIRRAFIALSQFGQVTTDASDARKLFQRFLRKEHN